MNLILLFPDDFVGRASRPPSAGRPGRLDSGRAGCPSDSGRDARPTVRLTGRRLAHVTSIHRAKPGDTLVVGIAGGGIGTGEVTRLDAEALELRVTIDREPPPPSNVTLVLALPRPKVLNRTIASATSLGVKRIFLINAWRVEKSYWKSPKLAEENLLLQRVLGLEQARDTILPTIETRRFFRPFVEDELPAIIAGTRALVPHPGASEPMPITSEPVTIAIGPEGGFIAEEVASLERIGFEAVSLGSRILRVETAVAVAVSRVPN